MRIFTERCTCDVCGGPGLARPDHVWGSWFGGLRHNDPAVCAEYLEKRRKRLDKREKAVREAEARLAASVGQEGPPAPKEEG